MKKIITYIIIVLIVLQMPGVSFAATPTPTGSTATPKASEEAELKTIEKIKEMVADKVSKLKIVDKRGFIGKVTDTSTTQITANDSQGTKRFVDIDELTKFQESIGSSKTFGISDIKKGDTLAFIGLYNKDTERLLARFVTKAASVPQFVEGKILSVDTENFQFTVLTNSGEKKKVDVLRSTTTKSFNPEDGEQKSGFSKLETGEFVVVSGYPDDDDKSLFSASRVLHLRVGNSAESIATPTP